jgi:Leucine-rich repeat (LRR) protein
MKLTPAIIASQAAGVDLQQLKDLNMSKKDINHIEDISTCGNLHKLILSHNKLSSTDSIAGLQYLPSLTLLNLSGNQLESFEGVQRLKTLFGNKLNKTTQAQYIFFTRINCSRIIELTRTIFLTTV